MKKKLYLNKSFRITGLLLVTLLVSLLLVACGGETTPTTAPTTATTSLTEATGTPEATAAIVAPPVFTTAPAAVPTTVPATTPGANISVIDPNLKGELVIWDGLGDKQGSALRELSQQFSKAYPGVKISVSHYDSSELVYAVEDAAKSGKLPDMLAASADFVTDFNQAKALQPADKAFDKGLLDGFVPNAMAGSNINGTQWGIPFTYSGCAVMLYNKKLVANPPQTWDELGKMVRPLYEPGEKKIGLAVDLNEPYILTGFLGGYGGSVLDSQNRPTLDTPQMVSALSFIESLIKDKTVRDTSRLKDNQIDYAFRDGRLAIYIGGDWLMDNYAGAINAATDDKLDLGIAPLPRLDKTGTNFTPFSNSKTLFVTTKVSGDRLKIVQTFAGWLAKPEQQASIQNLAKVLPATKAYLNSDTVKKDPVWGGLLAQLEASKPQPAAPEMRASLPAIRTGLQNVVAGVAKPAEAAKQMQQTALENVAKLAVKS